MCKKTVKQARKQFRAAAYAALKFSEKEIDEHYRKEIKKFIDQESLREHERYLGLSIDVPGKVAYSRYKKDRYDGKRRIRTTIGKYIAKFHPDLQSRIGSHAIDTFSSAFAINSSGDLNDRVSVLAGRSITDAYRYCVGGSSCMTGDCCEFVEIYELNPDVVSLAVCEYNGKKTRALMWKWDGETFVDRCYPNHSLGAQVLRQWARKKGYINRINDGAAFPGFDGNRQLTVTGLEEPDSGLMPYMDSLCYGSQERDGVTLSTEYSSSRCTLDSTSGGPWSEGHSCFHCGGRWNDDEDQVENGERYCNDCHNELFSYCDDCCEMHPSDDFTEVHVRTGRGWSTEYVCDHCAGRSYTSCDNRSCGCRYPDGEMVECTNGDHVCPECAENSSYCEQCDLTISDDDSPEEVNDEWLCSDCAESARNETSETGASA